MSYKCEICNYLTHDSGNFARHKKTKKHITTVALKSNKDNKNIALCSNDIASSTFKLAEEAIQKSTGFFDNSKSSGNFKKFEEFYCGNCDNTFKHSSSYYRHKKTCKINNNEDFQLKNKIQILEKENEMLKKIEKEKSELLNNFMNNANTLLNKAHDNTKITAQAIQSVSMSALKYANEKFKEAPALLPLEDFTINNLSLNRLEDRDSIIETLI